MGSAPSLEGLRAELEQDLRVLAVDIGPRHAWLPEALERAALFLEERFAAAGLEPRRQTYAVGGRDFRNLEVELEGRRDEPVVIGAHYDSVAVPGCAGANDNGTGVVALLALARRFAAATPERTLRFVAFVNEEPPFFLTGNMGSRVYARRCRERGERLAGMLSLETLGCYSQEPGSQRYPTGVGWRYPKTGDFVAIVGNLRSRRLVWRCVRAFERATDFPVQGGAFPAWLPGVGWSDQWSFWREGYRAAMATDTAPFRYPHYHTAGDSFEEVDLASLARVVEGLEGVVADLAGTGT